jgi:predicted porin
MPVFTISALFGLRNTAGNFATNSVKSFGASYANGPLTVALAYTNANSPNQSFFGNNQTSSATANNLGAVTGVTSSPAIAGFASAGTLETYGAAATYVIGSVTTGLMYTKIRFKNLNSATSGSLASTNPLGYTGSTSFDDIAVYGTWYMTPALYLSAGYNYMNGRDIDGKPGATYHTVNATLTYFLSKRTSIYLNGNYQRALGIDSTGHGAVSTLVAATPSNSGKQALVRLGMRHLF